MLEKEIRALPGVLPSDLAIGLEVNVEPRTYPGINKQGGYGTVTHIYYNEHGVATKVDVKYVLGGREKEVELTYVKVHVDLDRGSRSRRSMAVEKKDGLESNTWSGSMTSTKGKAKRKGSKIKGQQEEMKN